MRATSLIALLTLAACCAADDQSQRIQEAEDFAAKDLDKWNAAVAAKDNKAQAQMLGDVLAFLDEAEVQSERLGSISAPVLRLVRMVADARCPPALRMRLLNRITDLMSRRKDNLIYYRLDGIKQWIEKRPGSENDAELQQILKDVTDAREAVNDLGHGVGRGVLGIKAETGKPNPDQAKVRQLAAETVKIQEEQSKLLFSKLKATRAGLERLQENLSK